MSDSFSYDVFLSHSAKDKAVVRPLAGRLRKDGLRVWFDEWVLKPGDSIPAKMDPPSLRGYGWTGEGLEHSRVLVLCMSANALGSDWAQLEVGTFRFRDPLNKERRFIPLRLDDATGRFDFVLANPPFYANAVDKERLKDSVWPGRRFPFGLPLINNTIYLWTLLFNSATMSCHDRNRKCNQPN
jgi:hypothetical protein